MKNLYIQYLSGVINENDYYNSLESLCEGFDTNNLVMTMGKHKGKTFEQIDKDDPRYLPWLSNAEPKYRGQNLRLGSMVDHHVKKNDIENDLHKKIFIAKVKNNISAFNYIEKSVKVYENKPDENIRIGVEDFHQKQEAKVGNFSEGEIVLVSMATMIKIDNGWVCDNRQHDYLDRFKFELTPDKKCPKCGRPLRNLGYQYVLTGVYVRYDHMEHYKKNNLITTEYSSEVSKPEYIKTNYFMICKLSDVKKGYVAEVYFLKKEDAVRNLETLKVPGTDQQIFGYTPFQTIALANKLNVISTDEHKALDHPYNFRQGETYATPIIKHGIENDKKHIVSLPYKDSDFSISRKMNGLFNIKRQITIEKTIAFDIFCAMEYGISRIRSSEHDKLLGEKDQKHDDNMEFLSLTFRKFIASKPIPSELERSLEGETGLKLKESEDYENLVYLCKLCVYIKENGGTDAGVRSDKVMRNAIDTMLQKYAN